MTSSLPNDTAMVMLVFHSARKKKMLHRMSNSISACREEEMGGIIFSNMAEWEHIYIIHTHWLECLAKEMGHICSSHHCCCSVLPAAKAKQHNRTFWTAKTLSRQRREKKERPAFMTLASVALYYSWWLKYVIFHYDLFCGKKGFIRFSSEQ